MSADRDLVSFADVEDVVMEFLRLLERHGIQVPPESELGLCCSAATNILLRHWDSTLRDPLADVRDEFRDALAVYLVAKKTLASQGHADFGELVEHLKEMTLGGIRQNQWTMILDQSAPKIFELLIALAAMRVGTGLRLDDPGKSSGGKNPDVIATIDGARWAFACKMLNTFDRGCPAKPKAYFANIRDGVRQINNADVDHGLVIVSIKNGIDHERAWPLLNPEEFKRGAESEYDAVPDHQQVVDWLRAEASKLHTAMLELEGEDNVLALFANSKARPIAVQCLNTVTAVCRCGLAMPTPLLFLFNRADDLGTRVAALLNHGLQIQDGVTSGHPAGSGRG